MFINTITLEDFRIYHGPNTLTFHKDLERNIFIVSGNNGFGKTTLLASLMWCLYGKLMKDVDETVRKEVNESGGYKSYALNNLNRLAKTEGKDKYTVSINFSDIYIAPIPCKNLTISRTYSAIRGEESVEILIDGQINELTKNVGPDIFINDFILPREIAKFFFFDAEKIVSLAEMNSLQERRSLSRAYAEVLGIKKYLDLKDNLEDLRIRFRRNSASTEDRQQYDILSQDLESLKNSIVECGRKIEKLQEQKIAKKKKSEEYQERLIREGNSLSEDDVINLRNEKKRLLAISEDHRAKLRELMDLAPFVIAGDLFSQLRDQLSLENELTRQYLDKKIVEKKSVIIQNELKGFAKRVKIPYRISRKYINEIGHIIEKHFIKTDELLNNKVFLHNFTDQEYDAFSMISNNLALLFNHAFKEFLKEFKQNKLAINKVSRALSNAESKENDFLILELRQLKNRIDGEIDSLDKQIIETSANIGGMQKEITIKSKLFTELAKRIQINDSDQAKDSAATRIISELAEFITQLKIQKKNSLELKMLYELNRLLHKNNFITKVKVNVDDDLIDIYLYNDRNEIIPKESLSKGEQQLYATALLKALVDESNIKFPVFIDSPLQKFDREHSRNIINEFYPNVSEQVVLFPLLEKELSITEYEILKPKINLVYLIKNVGQDKSTFVEIEKDLLFNSTNPILTNV